MVEKHLRIGTLSCRDYMLKRGSDFTPGKTLTEASPKPDSHNQKNPSKDNADSNVKTVHRKDADDAERLSQ